MHQGSAKEFRINSSTKKSNSKDPRRGMQTFDEEVNNKLRKSQIISILLKLQNLRQEEVNNAMKDLLLGALKQFKD